MDLLAILVYLHVEIRFLSMKVARVPVDFGGSFDWRGQIRANQEHYGRADRETSNRATWLVESGR
jgi:hypothetical protein